MIGHKERIAARTGALAMACLMTAACDRPGTQDNAGAVNDARAANAAQVANDADEAALNAADDGPQRSILRPDVAPAPVIALPPEPIEGIVPFGTAGLKLDDDARKAIDALLAQEVAKSGGPVILRGNTDSRGSDGDNLVVSRKRAELVRDYMIARGVAADRISVVALGETRPIAPNAHLDGSDDPEGRAKNRRVDVEIRPPAPAPEAAPAPAENGATAE